MSPSPFRRITSVMLGYVLLAWMVAGLSGWLRRVLALPEMFTTLVGVALLVGAPITALLAWQYPRLGHGDLSEDRPQGRSIEEGR